MPKGVPYICVADGCQEKGMSRGLCSAHYAQMRRNGELKPLMRKNGGKCFFEFCELVATRKGLCQGHYQQEKKGDGLRPLTLRKENRPRICSYPECGNPHKSNGYCQGHYRLLREGKELRPLIVRTYRTKTSQGYILVKDPTHPNARKNGYVAEHTKVISELLGRPLTEKENIHHRNGIRDDNTTDGPLKADPETGRLYSGNLELWSTSQPAGQRVGDKVKWAREILELYGDLFPEEKE